MFVGLAGDRCEALLSSPSSTPFQHLRCMALLGGILAHVCGWMADYVSVLQGEQARLGSAVLWLFDGATIIVEATHGIIKYGESGGERLVDLGCVVTVWLWDGLVVGNSTQPCQASEGWIVVTNDEREQVCAIEARL